MYHELMRIIFLSKISCETIDIRVSNRETYFYVLEGFLNTSLNYSTNFEHDQKNPLYKEGSYNLS